MIDAHCHLNFHAFEKDYDEVIHRAHDNGVEIIINVGTKLDSSAKAVALAQQYKNLYAIVGVHPHHADKIELNEEARSISNSEEIKFLQDDKRIADPKNFSFPSEKNKLQREQESWVKKLESLAKMPKVVAIGEIGMDYYSYQSNGIVDSALQREIFESQIQLAHDVCLPIQIHNRHAGKDVIEILKHHKNILKPDKPGMFHCFAGDMDVLKGALDLGFYIGFDGNSTYPGLAPKETVNLTDLAKATPLDRMVTETDAPFLTPVPFRGSRNEPSHVILTGEFLAKIKGIPFEKFNEITTKNAKTLFNLP